MERLRALGHGSPTPMSSDQALAVAAGAHTHAPCQVAPGSGFEAGQAVRVMATDYGQDPVSGTLVGLSNDEVVVRRTDARAGTVHVNSYDEDDITVPFGGFKQSGVGRDKSLHAFDKYTETKTTWIRIDSPV